MKGAQGLIAAACLGSLGLALNWIYLTNKTTGTESVSFIGIAEGVTIRPGDTFSEDHFVEVQIPRRNAQKLLNFVYLFENRNTVAGIKATRPYQGGEFVYRYDYRTPPPELTLAQDERLIWIPVDSRSFVPSLVDPGDEITFIVPSTGPVGTGPAMEMIGPFRIGSLGNRLGTESVMKANHIPQVQERQVGIVVRVEGDKFEARAMKLIDSLQRSDYRNVGVALHPKKKE